MTASLRTLNRALLLIIIVLQIGDIITTNLLLRVPGAYEMNPVFSLFIGNLGGLWVIPKLVATAAIIWCLHRAQSLYATLPLLLISAVGSAWNAVGLLSLL